MNVMEENIKQAIRGNVDALIQNKEVLIKSLDNLLLSYFSGKDIYNQLDAFFRIRSPERLMVLDLLGFDDKTLEGFFKDANISQLNTKEMFELKNKYSCLSFLVNEYRYYTETGAINRWTSYTRRFYFDMSRKIPMIEVNMSNFNKEMIRIIDDASAIYRFGSLFQYITREELETMINDKIPIPKDYIELIELEINRNTEEHEKIKEVIKKLKNQV